MGGNRPETQRAYFKTWRERNRERHLEMQRASRAKYPEREQARNRVSNLKKFGLTPDLYQELLDDQEGVCMICGSQERMVRGKTGKVCQLAVDHDHETGAVRGLLCQACNAGIGQFRDNADLLESAVNYLRIPWEQR